jgi:four helix bundle protein
LLIIAFGSGAELETQIEIAKRLPFGQQLNYDSVDQLLGEIMRMLNKFISTLRS